MACIRFKRVFSIACASFIAPLFISAHASAAWTVPVVDKATVTPVPGQLPEVHMKPEPAIKKWVSVKTKKIKVDFNVDIRMKVGKLHDYWIMLGLVFPDKDPLHDKIPVYNARGNYGMPGPRRKTPTGLPATRVNKKITLEISGAQISRAHRTYLSDMCNRFLGPSKAGFYQTHTKVLQLHVYVRHLAYIDQSNSNGSYRVYGEKDHKAVAVPIKLVCDGAQDPNKFRVTKVEHKFSVKKGPLCPLAITTETKIYSSIAGTANYRRERKGGPPSEWIPIKTKKQGDKYVAVIKNTQNVNALDQTRRIVALKYEVGTETVTSEWLRYLVKCQPFKVTDLKLKLNKAKSDECPVAISAKVTGKTTGPGQFRHRLRCDNNKRWVRTLQAKKISKGKYGADFTHNFKVKKSRDLKCRAEGIDFNMTTPWKTVKIKCAVTSGSGGLTGGAQQPSQSQPSSESCLGGKIVSKDKCSCPKGKKPAKISKNKFRCIPCSGGKIKNGRCECPQSKTLVRGICIVPAG